MSYHERLIELGDAGWKSIRVPAGRFGGFTSEGGTVSMNNMGVTYTTGLAATEDDEELVSGACLFFGAPNARARAFFRF